MSNVKYLKGVRTRYFNILEKEVNNASFLIHSDLVAVDKNEMLSNISICVEKLQTYSVKLENQSEKLTAAVEDSDENFIEKTLEEDTQLCNSALNSCSQLNKLEIQLNKMIKQEEAQLKENTLEDRKPNMHEEIQRMLEKQIELQQELLETRAVRPKDQRTPVKLPKLEIGCFSGDKLRWLEFWQSFENSVHKNESLSNIDKFNYLRSKLTGEARSAIAGLSLSNGNYGIAIDILKDRFGNVQEIIDVHYNKMINLQSASDSVESLRHLTDSVDKHLRSLEVLGQNISQDVFVSVIKSKLPRNVIRHLEIQKGAEPKWTVAKILDLLKEYVIASEKAEKVKRENVGSTNRTFNSQRRYTPNIYKTNEFSTREDRNKISFEALTVNNRGNSQQINTLQCRYCSRNHWSDECPEYKSIDERKECLKGSCYRCLKKGHLSKDCKSRKVCVYCNEMNVHHRSLCPKKFKRKVIKESVHVADEQTDLSVSIPAIKENALLSSSEIVFMQTARTKIKDPLGLRDLEVRILLDSGSQRTYVTERLATSLNLKKEREQEIRLVTFGSVTPKVIKTASTKLNIKLKNGEEMKVTANIVPNITSAIHRKPVNIFDMRSFDTLTKNLSLADTIPMETETDTIDLLIGNDYYLDIVMGHKIEVQPGLYLLSSKLGWILTGRTNEVEENIDDINMLILTYGNNVTKTEVFTSVDESLPSKPDLEDFWKMEAIGICENSKNTDDEQAMKNFRDTLMFRDERYHITWPWKEENPEIPENRPLAVGRLKSLVSRLQSRPDVLTKYNAVIKDQLEKNIIEKIDKTDSGGIRHYIPHHAVIKPEKSTTKLRIVYDASAKNKCGMRTLNECLYRGPVLLNDLCGTLIRFRLHKIGIVADIEKAFLQICLQNSQRDVTRFLWLKDLEQPSVNPENIQEYRFCRVPFGVISSPFLLGATINYHLDTYDTDIAKKIKRDIYMDNLITGANSVSEAITLYKSSKQIFSEASMNLREWASNAEEVNNSIPVKDRAEEETMKVLGLVWNRESDTIRLQQTKILKDIGITKRTVLKQIAGVFDPLGLFSPVILKGKMLLQSLWIKHLQWDEDLVEEDVKIWLPIKTDLITVSDHEISRQVTANKPDGIESFLVCFCDASSKAYATTVYLVQHSKMERKAELMFTKTRLAPTTNTTIPRLELMAVLIGVRSVEFVRKQLAALVDCIYLFTDSQCTLKWIESTKPLSTFVKNRVQEIKSYKDIAFHYVDTKNNPADIASRGSTMEKLANNALWWHGPQWLKKPLNEWPLAGSANLTEGKVTTEFESEIKHDTKMDEKSLLTDDTMEKEKMCFPISAPFEIDSRQYSSVTKLLRVTATVMRFIKRLKGKAFKTTHLVKDEIEKVEKMWVLHTQKMNFEDVFHSITARKRNNLQTQLGVYIDDEGILRCKGRLEYSSLTDAARHPILLPNKDKLTHLIIECVHKQLLHSGVSQTLSKLRHRFWVPQGRATVRKVINNCLVCRRAEGGPYKMPPMAPLPPGRVSESTPFSQTGLDYMGPLYIKEENQTKKVWVCLFTCMVTRAVHIEMVFDMSTSAFLNCFRRFIASRGTPNEIVCDNAMHFKLASETTKLIWRDIIRCDEVQTYSSNQRIKWTFIVELAPWMGGFYERLVGLIKRSLRKAIGRKLLDSDKLNTVLKEAEATVNSRPLVYVGDDINSTVVITPGHFICLNPNIGIPETEIHDKDPDFKPSETSAEVLFRIWKKGQKLLDSFWNIWRHEYLTSLRERTQMKLKSGKLQSKVSCRIGDIVLIKDNMPRGSWRLGKVIELIQSADGFVRSARVQTQSGRVLGRPLCLLYPIETSDNKEKESDDKAPMQGENASLHTVRKARVRANERKK